MGRVVSVGVVDGLPLFDSAPAIVAQLSADVPVVRDVTAMVPPTRAVGSQDIVEVAAAGLNEALLMYGSMHEITASWRHRLGQALIAVEGVGSSTDHVQEAA